jgi:hypothetical protein
MEENKTMNILTRNKMRTERAAAAAALGEHTQTNVSIELFLAEPEKEKPE